MLVDSRYFESPPSYEDSGKYSLKGYSVQYPFRGPREDGCLDREVILIVGEFYLFCFKAPYPRFYEFHTNQGLVLPKKLVV